MSATRDMLRMVHAIVRPIKTKLGMLAARVVVTAIQDSPKLQTVTLSALFGEDFDGIQHMQPGGLTHVALPGAEGLQICLGGSREAPFVFAVSNRGQRPTGLLPGETALYMVGPLGGLRIKCKAAGEIEITPDAALGTPFVTVIGDVIATGEVTAIKGVSSVGLSTHLTPSPMGPLGPPTPGT